MANSNLTKAKSVKNDEFYTQYQDIEKEIMAYLDFNPNAFKNKTVLLPCDDPEWSNFTKFFAQNFERLQLKKLISTSYAPDSKKLKITYAPTLFETNAPQFDKTKTIVNGKIFTLDHDTSGDGKIDVNDLEWTYLKGDGDFKSKEIIKLRDEADIIITNPPFSLFREFLAWIIEADKQFVVIGSMNAITYRDVFAIIKNNKMWLGNGFKSGNAYFSSPISNDYAEGVFDKETGLVKFRNCCWFTNIDHGRRHQILPLMTILDNIKYSKHKELKGKEYDKYENFDAIDVSFTDAIPSDFKGAMGVPISFLDKYSPDQFEIIGLGISNSGIECGVKPYKPEHKKYRKEIQKRGAVDGDLYMIKDEIVVVPYARILIRHKK
jgi:Adenine-specific methyltransferase EcoRI